MKVLSWREGEVLLFDDTHVHSVAHRGRLPRYVLTSWFCHPCDTNPVLVLRKLSFNHICQTILIEYIEHISWIFRGPRI